MYNAFMTEMVLHPESAVMEKGQAPRLNEVLKLVSPEGACWNLDAIRITPGTLKDTSPYYFESRVDSDISRKVDGKVAEAKNILNAALVNEAFLRRAASKTNGGKLETEEIREDLGIYDPTSNERMRFILNHNFDPELIPFLLERGYREKSVPEIFVNQLVISAPFRYNLARILIDQQFLDELYKSAWSGSRTKAVSYSPANLAKVNYLINTALEEASRNHTASAVDIRQLRDFLERFFKLKQSDDNDPDLMDLPSSLKHLTGQVYFQVKTANSVGEVSFVKPELQTWSQSIYEPIKQRARATEIGIYLLSLYNRVKEIYGGFFPDLYIEPEVGKLIFTDPAPVGYAPYYVPQEGSELANGAYRVDEGTGSGVIELKSGTVMEAGGTNAFQDETYSFAGPKAKRRVVDPLTMFHEITHAIYEQRVRSKLVKPEKSNYQATADHAVNEGLAVMMELLFIDLLKQKPQLLGLDAKDIEDLERCKKGRLYKLKEQKNGYTEGAFRLWHKIFERGSGKGVTRDVNRGLKAIQGFLAHIDPQRSMVLLRTDAEYRQALKAGDPRLWLNLLSKLPVKTVA